MDVNHSFSITKQQWSKWKVSGEEFKFGPPSMAVVFSIVKFLFVEQCNVQVCSSAECVVASVPLCSCKCSLVSLYCSLRPLDI